MSSPLIIAIRLRKVCDNPTVHIFNGGRICRVELCTELFYAIIPTFADLLSLRYIFNAF